MYIYLCTKINVDIDNPFHFSCLYVVTDWMLSEQILKHKITAANISIKLIVFHLSQNCLALSNVHLHESLEKCAYCYCHHYLPKS